MSRTHRTHWRRQHTIPPMTMCCRPLFTGGSHGRGVCYAEHCPEYVDCLVCLYHMGRYMPLSKLYEHQVFNMKRCDFQLEFFT